MIDRGLRKLAVEALRLGRLPTLAVHKLGGGDGGGEMCGLCSALISCEEALISVPDTAEELRFHLPCFLAWQDAVRRPRIELS